MDHSQKDRSAKVTILLCLLKGNHTVLRANVWISPNDFKWMWYKIILKILLYSLTDTRAAAFHFAFALELHFFFIQWKQIFILETKTHKNIKPIL